MKEIYKHTYFLIGETLVDESKGHITSAQAVKRIRELMREMEYKLEKLNKANPPLYTSQNYGTVTCPNCRKPITLYDYVITDEWVKDNQFCEHCGQRFYND